MSGVICLANARIETQTAFAGSYVPINVFYLDSCCPPPPFRHWYLSRLEVCKIEVRGGTPPRIATMENLALTHTDALWKAIAETGTKQ